MFVLNDDLLALTVFALVLFSLLLGVAVYVMKSLALYVVAKRRGLRKAWLAWIPVANDWILGSVSDHYQAVTKGKKKNKRKILLGLDLAMAALMVVAVGITVAYLVYIISGSGDSLQWGDLGRPWSEEGQSLIFALSYLASFFGLGTAVLTLIFMFVLLPMLLIMAVVRWMAVYDVFRSCDPDRAIAYLLVSLLLALIGGINGLDSIFLLLCMRKDDGMIPQKTEIPAH